MHGWTIHATDGVIGAIDELLFDDERWTVRYLVVETGNWLSGRKVLLSPLSFGALNHDAQTLHVNLTREKIQNSPSVKTDEPVARRREGYSFDYDALPRSWSEEEKSAEYRAKLHLRSTKEVSGYGIVASDGRLGHIEDFLIDDETWKIDYLSVDTRDWLPGARILLSSAWIDAVSWTGRSVTVHATRDEIKNVPEWVRDVPIEAAFEARLRAFYNVRRTPFPHEG